MRHLRKFWLAPLLVASLALAACGTNDPGASPDTEDQDPEHQDTGGEGATGAEGELGGEITVWAMGAEGEKLGVLADAFTEESGVAVTVTPIPWDVAHDRLVTAVAGGETPDVSQMGTTWMGEFATIDALAATPEQIDQGAFFEGAWETGVVDGTSYGVPWYVETRMLYYRTDIAEQAGVTEAPGTWEDLKAMAEAMQTQGGAQYGIGLGTGVGSWQQYLPFVWSAGGDVLNEDGEFTLNSPEAVEALEYYASFFSEGLAEAQPEGFDITQGFIQGTHPMFFSGPWHIAILNDVGGEEFSEQWALAPMPSKDSATSFVGGSDLVVFEDSENQEAAWAFVEYVSRPEVQATWYEETAALPSVEEAWDSDALAGDERLSLFGVQLADAKSPPAIATWEEVAGTIEDQIDQATIGGTDPQAAVEAMQEGADSIGTGVE